MLDDLYAYSIVENLDNHLLFALGNIIIFIITIF